MNIYSHTGESPVRPLVIVFAKAPVPGSVKTRLIPRVGQDLACRLHHAFVRDTLAFLGGFRAELHTDRPTKAWGDESLVRKLQIQGDLGSRMFSALEEALSEGSKPVLILGSDSPALPSAYVRRILECAADVCLGPAADGGYYAISCRKVAPRMFDGVRWSTAETLAQTVQAVRNVGLTVELGPEWYDVDSGEDLDRLVLDPGLGAATREVLAQAGIRVPSRPFAP